jgi:hypothetical protein
VQSRDVSGSSGSAASRHELNRAATMRRERCSKVLT